MRNRGNRDSIWYNNWRCKNEGIQKIDVRD